MHDERFPGLRRRGFLAATGAATLGALALTACGADGTDSAPSGDDGAPKRGPTRRLRRV